MKRVALIGTLYAVIAAIASITNLVTQMSLNGLYDGLYAIELSVIIGTAFGALVRYFLVKRYIFKFESNSVRHDGRLFALYSFLGIFTTGIFWGTEFTFYWLFKTDIMRYLGASIGLTISYIVKYHLDKHVVFVKKTKAEPRMA